ncbi:MAG: ligase-associated DNA damage response endonuclease PdeM [Parvibaculales bacterium]
MSETQMALVVNGAHVLADISGALFWPAAQTLIVADLHFEKGSAYAARGVALPPYDTAATLARLEACMAKYRPKRVVSLGDAFHDDNWAARMAQRDADRLAALAASADFVWIGGNHDPTPPAGLAGQALAEMTLSADGELTFRHEPLARAADGFRAGELAGHLHPCARIRWRGRNLRRRCFVGDGTRLVLPAFGALTGSLNVCDAAFGPLFDDRPFMVWMMGENRLAAFPSDKLLPDAASAQKIMQQHG